VTIEIRGLARTELGALSRLHALCFPNDAWTVRDFLELLSIRGASGHIAAAPRGGKNPPGGIAGFILDIVNDDAEILTIGVAPDFRRAGIAHALIDHLAQRAKTKGAGRILLEVAADNYTAIRLYENKGFSMLGERPGYYRRPWGSTDAYIFGFPLVGGADQS
jgi:[ribosomal protein S18]-alanine N-acetyltransferase